MGRKAYSERGPEGPAGHALAQTETGPRDRALGTRAGRACPPGAGRGGHRSYLASSFPLRYASGTPGGRA